MITSKIKRLSGLPFPGWTTPLFLAFLCIFSFGILIPKLGFYWDDWAKILVYRLQGPANYLPYYAGDRPFSAWTHIALTPILGVKPAAWQFFTLSMRFFSAWGLFNLLFLLKPTNRFMAIMAASIFAVYPLFSQQAIAVTFHQHWMQFALIIASFDCMVLSVRSKRHRSTWFAISFLLSILQLSITEFFAPLELLRSFILWFAIPSKPNRKEKFLLTLKAWLPFFILIAAFFIWRIFIMPLPMDEPYRSDSIFNFFTKPTDSLTWMAKTLVVDLSYIFFSSWATVFQTRLSQPISLSFLAILFGSIVTGASSIVYLVNISKPDKTEVVDHTWVRMAIILGLTGVFLGPMSAWITHRQVLFDFHSDRFALPALLGLSILSVGIIEWLGRSRLQKAVLAGIIIMLGSGYQLRTANDFRNVWTQQMRLYWQLNWRVPQLKSPTAIYSETDMIPNQELFSMSAALNQLYPQDANKDLLDFWFYTLRPKYNAGPPKSFKISNDTTFRTLHFIGNSPNTLLVNLDPSRGNCLWVLRPEDQWNPYLTDLTRAMLPISNLERIKSEPAAGYPPDELFGKEPTHNWCYSFEKAELAWQNQNWAEIVHIGDELKAAGLSPKADVSNSPREWWPFIVGYAHDGQVRRAIEISQQSLQQDKRYHEAICKLWINMQNVPNVGVGISELGCSEP